MARGAPDYQQRIFAATTLDSEDNIVTERMAGVSPGGDVTGTIGPVPAGRYWIINHIAAWNTTSPSHRIESLIREGVTPHMLSTLDHPSPYDLYWWDGTIWLDEGWTIETGFFGTALNDWLEWYCNGTEVVKR